MEKCVVSVKVNGRRYERSVEPRMLLSDFLRHELSLTGTHVGCEHGVCGSCTVLVDGVATRSCLCFAVQVEGQSIETVESLGRVEDLHPIQLAFWEKHGLQCGFCTPGMLMSAVELLRSNPNPDREAILQLFHSTDRNTGNGLIRRCGLRLELYPQLAAMRSRPLPDDVRALLQRHLTQ